MTSSKSATSAKLINGSVPTPAFLLALLLAAVALLGQVDNVKHLLPWVMAEKIDTMQTDVREIRSMVLKNTETLAEIKGRQEARDKGGD